MLFFRLQNIKTNFIVASNDLKKFVAQIIAQITEANTTLKYESIFFKFLFPI